MMGLGKGGFRFRLEIWPFLVSMYQDFWGVTHLSLGHRQFMSREVCIDGEVPMVPDQLE